MAPTISTSMHCLLLFLLLAPLTHCAIMPEAKPKPHIDHDPHPPLPSSSSRAYIVHADHLRKPSRFATLQHWYASMVATYSHRPRDGANRSRILYTYDTVMHGFAVHLTAGEARRMSGASGVVGVYEDRVLRLHTTRSPGFVGLNPEFGAWPDSDFGDGVIIGFIDSGVWPESASFRDDGLGPVRPSWRGGCVDGEGFNASTSCNNKLVGAKYFSASMGDAFRSPRDGNGHGTHVASTAAGAEDAGAKLFSSFSQGTARGMAPRARIAMYRACDAGGGCSSVGIVAAMDAAVKDGVDIMSISLGGGPVPFHLDGMAIAAFGAERHGVLVVFSAGNSGPHESTVENSAPWITTVGASTADRLFPASLRLGNGVVLHGQSLYDEMANSTGDVPLASIPCNNEDDLVSPDKVMGKIVVCMQGAGAWHTILVQSAGGAGLVSVVDTDQFADGVAAPTFTLPALTVAATGGEKLAAYIASTPYPVASFSTRCETVTGGETRAPVVTGFSSRGPNSLAAELLKPDVVAPGVNILAAWPGNASLTMSDFDARTADYNIISGTSMACPHVAGVAALVKKKHRGWSPAMIRSALMTTAATLDNHGRPILDNAAAMASSGGNSTATPAPATGRAATPLVAGAGLVRPQLAMDPGLVYDAGEQDYVDFLCTLNYTVEQVRKFVPDLAGCERMLPGGAAGLNYPSFVVAFDGGATVRTLTRTVTWVAEKPETYNVAVAAPDGVKVTVTPTTMAFMTPGEKKSYTVEFRSQAATAKAGWDFGHITWENRKRQVRSPVAFVWKNN